MPYFYYPPSGKLSKYVATYFLIENEILPDCGIELTIYPNGHIIMGIAYGDILPVITDKGETFTVPNPGVSGRYMHPVSIRFFDARILITIFKPFGFYYIFGVPQGMLFHQTIALKNLGISDGEMMVHNISKSKSVTDKIDCLENWLLGNLKKNNVVSAGLTEYLVDKIIQSQGIIPLKNILSDLRLNRRYLERHFNEYLGTGAKELSKIIRFSFTANYLIQHPTASALELCEIGHFYDPSHLIREFNKYAGFSPTRFIDKIHNDGSLQMETLVRLNLARNII
jgi:AraC-like DNA-binding protein